MIYKKKVIAFTLITLLSGCDNSPSASLPNTVQPPENTVVVGKTLLKTPNVISKGTPSTDSNVSITLAATSDLHGRLFGYDYATLSEDTDAGLTRVTTLIDKLRAKDKDAILIDIGDTVQGNSASLFNDQPTHPMVEALNTLNYDVWVPGNHEFNFERSFLDRNVENFQGAVISSNIKWEETGANYVRAFQIFNVKGVKVAIVGLTPSYVTNWEASAPDHFAGLTFESELKATREAVDQAIKEYQPDVVIGTLHLGRDDGGTGIYKIASALADKFDVIFAGHEHATYIEKVKKGAKVGKDISVDGQHSVEDKTLAGVYDQTTRLTEVKILEPGKWGSALAQATINLTKVDGNWKISDTTLANLSTKHVQEEKALQSEFQYVQDKSLKDASTVLGNITGNFTQTENGQADAVTHEAYDADAGRLYSTIHYAKIVDSPIMDFINQIQLKKTGAQISAASLFSDKSSLIDGNNYTKAKSANLYKYDNTLLGINMTGENLKKYMEWSYKYFNQYHPGDLTYSFKKGEKSYNYDQFDGVIKYTVDLTKAEYKGKNHTGDRINISEIAGKPFDPKASYKVAVNSYRFGSQIKVYGWATQQDVYYDSTNEAIYAVRDMLTDYAVKHKGVNVDDFDNNLNWSFVQDKAIQAARHDNGAGEALWKRLQAKKVCVQIDWNNAKYPGIAISLNPKNSASYFVNTKETTEACNLRP